MTFIREGRGGHGLSRPERPRKGGPGTVKSCNFVRVFAKKLEISQKSLPVTGSVSDPYSFDPDPHPAF